MKTKKQTKIDEKEEILKDDGFLTKAIEERTRMYERRKGTMDEQIHKDMLNFLVETKLWHNSLIEKALKNQEEETQNKIEEFYRSIQESVNVQKELLKKFPESQFHIGRIQGLRTAEDNFEKIFGDDLIAIQSNSDGGFQVGRN